MPAATAEKRARQRANKLLWMESEATAISNAPTPAETISASLSTPDPLFFTISYLPVSISYPEPTDPTAPLPTDAIRVTWDQLADILHQSYVHGSEHGWKTHFAAAKERLQASYEKDMQAAAATYAEHEKKIREEAFDRGFEYGCDGCTTELASLQESLTAEHQKQNLVTLADFDKRCQESREEGIREERKSWESTRASLVNIATQTDSSTTTSVSIQVKPTTASISIQSNLPFIPSTSTASISTQTEPLFPTISESSESPASISESTTPAIIVPTPFNWANDAVSLPTIPTIPSKQARDLSGLRSSSKNPFSSLHRRHHYSKRPQIFSSCHHTHSYPTHPPLHHTPPFHNNLLDWRRDPRLFELSRVLRTLGWSHP